MPAFVKVQSAAREGFRFATHVTLEGFRFASRFCEEFLRRFKAFVIPTPTAYPKAVDVQEIKKKFAEEVAQLQKTIREKEQSKNEAGLLGDLYYLANCVQNNINDIYQAEYAEKSVANVSDLKLMTRVLQATRKGLENPYDQENQKELFNLSQKINVSKPLSVRLEDNISTTLKKIQPRSKLGRHLFLYALTATVFFLAFVVLLSALHTCGTSLLLVAAMNNYRYYSRESYERDLQSSKITAPIGLFQKRVSVNQEIKDLEAKEQAQQAGHKISPPSSR